jgi:RNA polymerase sigma factor (sigma-70 family)
MSAGPPRKPQDATPPSNKEPEPEPLSSTLRHVQNVQEDTDSDLSWQNLHEKITRWVAEAVHGQGLPPDKSREDLTQEVLLQVCRDIGAFQVEPGASFSGWVRTIAHRKLADVWRRAKSQKRGGGRVRHLGEFDESGGREHFADPNTPRPSMLARHGELQQALVAALDQLGAKHKKVLELRLFQGLSFAEIAPRLGYQKEVTVRSLHMRALQRLQELLAGFGG